MDLKNKIYTKKGDKGETGTFHGRMAKSDALPEAIGSIDELNSWIGVCRSTSNPKSQIPNPNIDVELKRIQFNLFTIGSQLAGSKKRIMNYEVRRMEKLIDKMTAELPKLSNFIYPVGELQLARAVARRCERKVVSYKLSVVGSNQRFDENILRYLNRLSDALFTFARWENMQVRNKEEVWK